VIQMNRSRNITPRRILAFTALLFGAIVTTMALPAYGQQDVDPTWYDPYAVHTTPDAAPKTVAAHAARPEIALRHQAALAPTSLALGTGKSHGKQPATAVEIRTATALTNPRQEAKIQPVALRRDQTE
jgi:hypothetical protein